MTDFYSRAPNDLTDDYKSEQTSIVKKKYLKFISRLPYEEAEELPLSQILDWYPLANSYYPYTEDVDAFARVNHLLGSKPSFESFTSIAHCENIYDGNVYSEKEAQLQYLYKQPVSFLILGKPGIGEQELGKLLTDYWNCVYIEPETLITEEIASNSRAGQCIDFNLRSGRAIGIDVIMRLLEKRVKTKTAQHRGFVICGFPLIPNDLYSEEPMSSESAVFNVHEIFEDLVDTTIEIGVPPVKPKVSMRTKSIKGEGEEETAQEPEENLSEAPPSSRTLKLPPQDDIPADLGSAIVSNICADGTLGKDFEEQIDIIFSQFSKPFMLIYMMCSNSDVVYKRKDCLYDFLSNQMFDLQREHNDKMVYTFFSKVPKSSHHEIPDDVIDIIKNNTMALDTSQPRLLLKLPKDFPVNVANMLDRYRYSALPSIERHVLLHHYEYLLKVDGRISPVRMFNAVRTKLKTLPLQKVIIPQKLLVPGEAAVEGPGDVLDVEGLTHEECFEIFKRKYISSTMFKWSWSDWGIKCPVSMSEGDYQDGDPKLAVQFMNKIFFLCDEEAYLKFYLNPRTYLLPPYPKPSCKICVLGPGCSGKTAVAKCLGYLVNGEIVDYNALLNNLFKLKENEYLERVRQVALMEGMDNLDKNREQEWMLEQEEKHYGVEFWLDKQRRLLMEAITLKDKIEHDEDEVVVTVIVEIEALEMASFPIKVVYNTQASEIELSGSDTSINSREALQIKNTIKELQILLKLKRLPSPTDMLLCEELLQDEEKLLEYLPENLRPETTYIAELATVDDDYVQDYAEGAVRNASMAGVEQLTVEYISQALLDTLKEIEEKNRIIGNTKGGWIIDGLPPNQELFDIVLTHYRPDDLFVMTDNDNHSFLLQRFETRGLNHFRNFRNFFMSIGKHDAAWRSPSLKSTESYKSRIATDLIEDVLEATLSVSEQKIDPSGRNETEPYFQKHPRRAEVIRYENELTKFNEDWEKLKNVLNQPKLTITEVNVANKSLEQLMKEVVKNVEDRYRQLPSPFTSEDRLQELQDFGEPELGEDTAAGEGDEEQEEVEDTFFQNRRFGDTFNFCPVTFHDNWVLWKGKEELTVRFEDRLYLLSSGQAMENFLEDPRRYLHKTKPPKMFPPPRICVVGVMGCGKSTASRTLSRNLGLYYKNYNDLLRDFISSKKTFTLAQVLKMGLGGSKNDMVKSYLTSGEALDEKAWTQIVASLWLDDPIKTFGFVFDGFPKRSPDSETMIKTAMVPDIIVELTISEGELHKRLMDKFMVEWQIAQNDKQDRIAKERMAITNAWSEERYIKFTELLDQRREERYLSKLANKIDRPYLEDLPEIDEEADDDSKPKSQISFDSVAEQGDIDEVNQILAETLPEPVFVDEPDETVEEAVSKFSSEIMESYARESDHLRHLRENCELELIPWVTVDAGMAEDKVLAQIMFVVDKYKFRNESLFERVYDISVDLAERLLATGYYFLSAFGKTCPVQVYEKFNSIQMFLPMEEKFQLHPLIHRQYIYYLTGNENHDKFKENPLKYTRQKNYGFPLIPMRLGIIGPPKSGKTTLAERFRRDLAMKVISRGQAARYVLRYLEFSELAKSMDSVLRMGWELTYEMIAKCAEAVAFDGKSMTQGFVLDGFPCTIEEVRHLAEVGMVPRLVIDLQATHADVFEFLGTDKTKTVMPVFPKKLVEHLYDEWSKNEGPFKDWLDKEYQIVCKVPVKPSTWGVWTAAFEFTSAILFETKHYFKLSAYDVVLRLANMQVSPLEFIERQSLFKSFCPCCIYYNDGLLNSGGDPPDRTGVVQFRKYFYYLCQDHIDVFVEDPEKHLPPYSGHLLPPDLPKPVRLVEKPQNVYEEGLCVICYWDNQPLAVVNSGLLEYGVHYRDRIYLFDTDQCMKKFMGRPHKYYAKVINFKGVLYPSLTYKELPVLGLLEQYDVKQLIKAIVNTGVLRPVIPGLSIESSGALNVGLFLKVNNPRTPLRFLEMYAEAQKKYHERRLNLLEYLGNMKKMINPYLYYDEPMLRFEDPLFPYRKKYPDDSISEGSTKVSVVGDGDSGGASTALYDEIMMGIDDYGEARRVPVPDDRFDYLCNYFKPLSKVPAFLNIVDIAGLVKGASEGQGLGNAFLSHISACDAIFHLCRAFEDSDVTHIDGEVDPVRDLETIGEELRLKDEDQLNKHLDKLERTVLRGSDKKSKPEYDTLVKVKGVLVDQKQHIRFSDWNTNEIEILNKYLFLTSKPMIYLVNLAEKDYIKKKNKWLVKIKDWINKNDPGATLIPFSGMYEQNVSEIEDPILRQKHLEDNAPSALDKIILQGYKALQLEYFFTAGADEVKAWTIQKGTKAPQAAGKIHTDFEKGFIMAEVMKFTDFKEEGSESAAKAAGKYRQQGRNYVVEDGDIIFFKFNAGAGLKDPKKK